ncbi:alpha/beta fold hydrolase [Halieaceae bacterium IMCC14734]|uniref:Alpha/beta fold hydrolase n=1 Tax=Candidatus Litorirhabdus singularis TaxID=2518993 RepID=A0ABT3TER0_9GAMM|nr:alpha/beta fold hydrolase [Candidatus Litorirhabdus singularis]
MSIEKWQEYEFDLGNFPLQSGEVLSNGKLHYHQFGALNAPKSNLILMPTYYGGCGIDNYPWVDDPSSPLHGGDYCVIIPCMFGAGESSSPSNTGVAQAGADFPTLSLVDNVRAQRELIKCRFADAIPCLVMGWSMGGMQALQWAQLYPERVGSLLAICATAKCYPHNRVFLDGVASALMADAEFADGHYTAAPERGLTAFAKVYAGWAYSQAFFRDALYRELGFESIDELLSFWVEDHLNQDANNLLVQLNTWRNTDSTSIGHAGEVTLQKLRCPGVLMPSSSDLYFTAADAARDAAKLGAQLKILESDFGHIAGGPGRLADETQEIFKTMEVLLQ